jgi:hypothetical protein
MDISFSLAHGLNRGLCRRFQIQINGFNHLSFAVKLYC